MATSSIYPYEYFLPTQGIDAARGKIDLERLFNRPGQECLIELRSISGRSCLYVHASLELSDEVIARLAGRTNTPLERLRKIDTRPVTSETSFAAASARRASLVASSHTASYQTHAPPVSGPASQSTDKQHSMHTTSPSYQQESYAGDQRLMAGIPRYLPTRPTEAPGGPAANVYSYSATRYYHNDSPERGQDERTSPSGPHPMSQNEPQDEEDDVNPDAAAYDARNDAFFFPPNSVSASVVRQRREMMRGVRGAVDR